MATDTLTLPHIAKQLSIQVDRLQMLQHLTRLAIESLPSSTDSDATEALLNGMKEILDRDTGKLYQLSEGVASMAEPAARLHQAA